jgi:hypothetical protein
MTSEQRAVPALSAFHPALSALHRPSSLVPSVFHPALSALHRPSSLVPSVFHPALSALHRPSSLYPRPSTPHSQPYTGPRPCNRPSTLHFRLPLFGSAPALGHVLSVSGPQPRMLSPWSSPSALSPGSSVLPSALGPVLAAVGRHFRPFAFSSAPAPLPVLSVSSANPVLTAFGPQPSALSPALGLRPYNGVYR